MADTVFVRPGLAQVTSDRYGRFYEWKGKRYFSVTTILSGGVPKPILVNWAKKFVAEYAMENYELLGKKLEIVDEAERTGGVELGATEYESVRKWLSDSPYRDRDKKADLGTLVHDYAEAFVLEKPMPAAPDDVVPYLNSFGDFLHKYQPEFIAVEAPVFSHDQKYAGTLDAIADFHPSVFPDTFWAVVLGSLDDVLIEERIQALHAKGTARLLVDWKSGKDVYPEVALQLAAYRNADTFLGMPDASEAPMPEVDGCIAVNLRPDGYKVYPVMTDETIYRTFLYAREIFRWGRDYHKLVLGKPQE